MSQPDDDTTLLHAWRGGDVAAGNALFGRYFASLWRFFNTKIESDAEDLVQETLMGCVRAEHRITGSGDDSSFRAYLYGIAWNILRDALRRKHRRPELDFSVERLADLTPSPSSILHHTDRRQRLVMALRNLPADDQVIVELYYWEGLRSRQIAEVMDIPPPTARSRIRRASDRLSEELERLEGSPVQTSLADSFRDLAQAFTPRSPPS